DQLGQVAERGVQAGHALGVVVLRPAKRSAERLGRLLHLRRVAAGRGHELSLAPLVDRDEPRAGGIAAAVRRPALYDLRRAVAAQVAQREVRAVAAAVEDDGVAG